MPARSAGPRRSRRSPTAFVRRYLAYLPRQRYPLRDGRACEQRVRTAVRARLRARGRRSRAGGVVRRCGAPLVWRRSRCARSVGAVGRGFPVAGVGRSGSDAARAGASANSRHGSTHSCRSSRAASRPRCSRRRSSTIAAIRSSSISTVSIFPARGVFAASRRRCRPLIRASERLREAGDVHLAAGHGEGLASGEYVGEHWLATFATLALTAVRPALDSPHMSDPLNRRLRGPRRAGGACRRRPAAAGALARARDDEMRGAVATRPTSREARRAQRAGRARRADIRQDLANTRAEQGSGGGGTAHRSRRRDRHGSAR